MRTQAIAMSEPGRRDLLRLAARNVADDQPDIDQWPVGRYPSLVVPAALHVALRTNDFGVVIDAEGPFADADAAQAHVVEHFGGRGYPAPFQLRRLTRDTT